MTDDPELLSSATCGFCGRPVQLYRVQVANRRPEHILTMTAMTRASAGPATVMEAG